MTPHPICQIREGWPGMKNMIKSQRLISILSSVQSTLKEMVQLNL